MTQSRTLGIDFGTSNSAAGYRQSGALKLVEIEPDNTTFPTSVFFDFDSRATLFGTPANAALIAGEYGRFMRALKSVLGTGLMREKRRFMDEQLDFIDIIGRFLREIKQRAEAESGLRFSTALSGRPVHFHSDSPAKDQQALADLTDCYKAAGFSDVRFMLEPEAAALANHRHLAAGSTGLIVDIGGGTSDFSLFNARSGGGVEIIASHGVRIGGTDFDRQLSIDHVMPLLGKGSQIRNAFGPETLPAPNAIFHNLATWEKIPFLYTAESRREAAMLHRQAAERTLLARLSTVLEHELGHDIAFAVERGKIEANRPGLDARIDLGILEPRLSAPLSAAQAEASLQALTRRIETCATETLALAGLRADQVDSLIFVGGSSLMHGVETAMQRLFSTASPHRTSAFTAVVVGLALAADGAFS